MRSLPQYLLDKGRTIAATRQARRGLAIDSSCWVCWEVISDADATREDWDSATDRLTTAVNLLGERDPRRKQLLHALAALEKKAEAAAAQARSPDEVLMEPEPKAPP